MKYTKKNLQRMKFLREVVLESSLLTKGMGFKLEELRPVSHKSIVVKKLGGNHTSKPYYKRNGRKK